VINDSAPKSNTRQVGDALKCKLVYPRREPLFSTC